MTDVQAVLDRLDLLALPGQFTDAGMQGDYDRFASLFTEDGVWHIPAIDVRLVGRDQIRSGVQRLQATWEYFVQTVHPGSVRVEGDAAAGRAYVAEFGRRRTGESHLNYAAYHDSYLLTPQGWRFRERRYEVLYVDPSPLPGTSVRTDA